MYEYVKDDILNGLKKLMGEWKNRTPLKQEALTWAINKRIEEISKIFREKMGEDEK